MTAEQLALFAAVLVLWIVIVLGIYPWLQGKAVRRDLRIAGYMVLTLLLVISLLTAPSLTLWFEYMGIALLVLLALLIYNIWAMRAQTE